MCISICSHFVEQHTVCVCVCVCEWVSVCVCVCMCMYVLPSRNGSTSRSFVKKEYCTLFTCVKRNAFTCFCGKWYLTIYSDLRDAFLIYLLNCWYSYPLFTESLIPIQIRWAAFYFILFYFFVVFFDSSELILGHSFKIGCTILLPRLFHFNVCSNCHEMLCKLCGWKHQTVWIMLYCYARCGF